LRYIEDEQDMQHAKEGEAYLQKFTKNPETKRLFRI
jgi:hypothetical protein